MVNFLKRLSFISSFGVFDVVTIYIVLFSYSFSIQNQNFFFVFIFNQLINQNMLIYTNRFEILLSQSIKKNQTKLCNL